MRTRGRIGTTVLCIALIFAGTLAAVRVAALPAQAATITGVNEKTGVVTGKVNSTGQVFEFTLTNKALISRLHAGEVVYVDLSKKEVSLDGKTPAGTILTPAPIVKKLAGPTIAPSGAGTPSGSGSSTNTGNSNPTPVPPTCAQSGGTSNPQTADNFPKNAAMAPVCFTANCNTSTTISGNTFPAGTSDWLAFVVPASRANCATPFIQVNITSSGGIVFDVYHDAIGNAVADNTPLSNSPSAVNVPGHVQLGTVYSPLPPGTYYIKVHGGAAPTGTWTLKIMS